ncbi:MAG: heme biosynthesis protein HemY [Rhodobacteraceae bacterium]|nr:heme biosynthesis protein HemY [Paracoccaceae bacterium]
MLWSLFKILLFIGLITALSFVAGYLMEVEGGVRISIATQEFNLEPLQATVVLLALILAIWVLLKLVGLLVAIFRFLHGDETAISRYLHRNRERKGFEALADGLMALASGEPRLAMSRASKAEKYLRRPELTDLVAAQAAEMAGDTRKAGEVYKRLLRDDRTRFVAVRGIMKQKLAEGDTDTALKLAAKAFALKPSHEDTQDVLLKLQAEAHDWQGARATLAAKYKYGFLPRDVHKRRDAVLALSEAKDVLDDGNSIEAREAAIEANRLSPDLIPAAVMAARGYVEEGKSRYATRVLKKAWGVQPHPDLAAAFAEIVPDESPTDRVTRFQTLTRQQPEHPETKMLAAELLIAAEDFPAARRALGDLASADPTTRSLTLMAAIERGEGGDDAVVRAWLTKALSASRGPQWVCENCHNIQAPWAPVCDNCGGFDTLAWTVPPSGGTQMPGPTDMLPVLVGRGSVSAAEPVPAGIEDAETIDATDDAAEGEQVKN